ncbi:MAG: formylglycine-generating enzyme family protein, partial [Rhodospirillales bacterium]|nr:formylglycine-generating enzyme family protein [Rhodospirillales bacterium]
QQYVTWLGAKTGQHYRLLTEAEWEYVARAGSQSAYWSGDAPVRGQANCNGCGSAWDNRRTAPVGSFPANAFGIHDMAGNVWEWVQDCYQPQLPASAAAIDDGGGCRQRVLRGGSWLDTPKYTRSAERSFNIPGHRDYDDGFRVARDLP